MKVFVGRVECLEKTLRQCALSLRTDVQPYLQYHEKGTYGYSLENLGLPEGRKQEQQAQTDAGTKTLANIILYSINM